MNDSDEANETDKKYLVMDTTTMKVWMEHKKVTRDQSLADYYLTHIWLNDPYNQIL